MHRPTSVSVSFHFKMLALLVRLHARKIKKNNALGYLFRLANTRSVLILCFKCSDVDGGGGVVHGVVSGRGRGEEYEAADRVGEWLTPKRAGGTPKYKIFSRIQYIYYDSNLSNLQFMWNITGS